MSTKKIFLSFIFILALFFGNSVFSMEASHGIKGGETGDVSASIDKHSSEEEEGEVSDVPCVRDATVAEEGAGSEGAVLPCTVTVDNVHYTQLETINQFDMDVVRCVVRRYEEVGRELDEKYDPRGTCPVQAIRNAKLMCEFLESNDEDKLGEMNSNSNAHTFLQKVIDADQATSWLRSNEVEERIEGLGLSEKITVLNSVIDVSAERATHKINRIKINFRGKVLENYSHVFIVGTGELFEFAREAIRELERPEGCRLAAQQKSKFLDRFRKKVHWYVVAIRKCGDSVTCFIIDTIRSNDHIKKQFLLKRDRYLCEHILGGTSSVVDFRKKIKSTCMRKAREFFEREGSSEVVCELEGETFVQNRIGAPSISSKLLYQKTKPFSKGFMQIIRKTCPMGLNVIIFDYRHSYFVPTKYLPNRILLYGPNGTGKSTLARYLAQQLRRKLIYINAGLLGTEYKNSAQCNLVEAILPYIETQEPCVLLLDEVDALISEGDDHKKDRNRAAAIAQVMDVIEGAPNVFLVWTTNHLDEIAKKFISRIGLSWRRSIIRVPLPRREQRVIILKYLIRELEREIIKKDPSNALVSDKIDCEDLALLTSYFSIRHLKDIVQSAFLIAVRRVSRKARRKKIRSVSLEKSDFVEAFQTYSVAKIHKYHQREGISDCYTLYNDRDVLSGEFARKAKYYLQM